MLYKLLQAQHDGGVLVRAQARYVGELMRLFEGCGPVEAWRQRIGATLEMVSDLGTSHERPPFDIPNVRMNGRVVDVREEVVARTPFATLLRFAKASDAVQPRVLVVAPMSGHFATLLRGTVEVLLPDHDVHITDWINARDVPVAAGRFGFDEFVEHIMTFLRTMGPGSHVLAVCQPAPAVMAAAALMAEAHDPATPRSMILMAGPIDTRLNPTKVNALATSQPIEWFERKLIGTVPWRHRGAGRKVYPGAMQLMAFMAMNFERHMSAYRTYHQNLVEGDRTAAAAHRRFYDEYYAVMDLPAEYYLETIRMIFQEHALPKGKLTWRGQQVRMEAIRRTAVLAVEGERDDICSVGQTMAALDLCCALPLAQKRYHLQTGVGHYGVFNGRRWATEVYPVVREVIQTNAA